MEIKEKTTVEEAIKKSPAVAAVFKKHRLDCASCRGAKEDTIEKVALNNGLDLKALLKELNKAFKDKD
ncbi:MAG: disulfide oxidoreductase [Spirochaetes bacterium]|jgi:hybrid cluster-associated redox disulfide protein|nr:disulfide oxidoreductase [Spirochaetota bacterium]